MSMLKDSWVRIGIVVIAGIMAYALIVQPMLKQKKLEECINQIPRISDTGRLTVTAEEYEAYVDGCKVKYGK